MESRDLDILITIDSKVDEVKEKLHSIEITQTRMESDLKYHIKRTDLLEGKVFEIDEKIKPVETVKELSFSVFKLVSFIAAIAGAAFAITNLLKSIK